MAFRDDKQETMVVRPYPQVQTHGQPPATPQTAVLKSSMPSRHIAPAPASNQAHLPTPPKVPSHITVTIESSIAPTPSIPVATISGQQGHSSNLHHLLPANIHIIRGSAPALQIGTPAVPPQTFTSHLPRGAAAAAVMSSTKSVLRPATGASAGPGQPTVQHIIHQTLQSRPALTTSTTVLPTVVAPISATRTQSPVISPTVTHSAEVAHGRPGLTIHPSATVSIQRPQASRDTGTRITLPSNPAIGAGKPQPSHTMAQVTVPVTPVAAATVAPIVATNTVPSTTTIGTVPHTQMTSSTIVTMTMASHSSHATAVTTSAIPVAKVVPQPIAHSSSRVQSEYPGERANLIPIPAHRSSPNPVTMEARSDNRSSVPVQFQYFLPAYSSSYPLTHTYTPISSSVSTIRQYPVTPQAPSSGLPTQAGVGVATTVHLNHMQLMAVDRIGLPSAQISTQGIQPAPIAAQGIQPAPIGVQGLHTSAPITTQGIQQTPIVTQQQQPQAEAKPGVVLTDGFVASPISSTFSTTQPVATMVQAHAQGGVGAPTLVSSSRPSILRKKPANEGLSAAPTLAAQTALAAPAPGDLIPGASPRKKPRKQQHVISTEESEMVETNSTDEEKAPGRPITGRAERRDSPPREYVDEEGVRYVPVRPRPPVTLLRHYRNPWKAAYHHFQRYSDIRVKEEKKGTLQDMANQRGVACRAQGWKIHLCAAQLRQLSSLEHDVYSRLSTLQEGLIPKKRAGADDDLHRINELIQGNMQRCKLVMDQVTEARDSMMKVLDHKEKVLKLLNKNGAIKKSSKLKRKERA
uniref:Histone deacetylase complex subunit SAP130 C-terminal domain-containing protein n=1 Tax=Salarias fasciatus TaxID=181472 RepID=A0A672G9M4_SALFA